MLINGKDFTKEDIARRFLQFCTDNGITKNGACGVIANNYLESALRCNNAQDSKLPSGWTDEQYTKAVDYGTYSHPTSHKDFEHDGIGYGWAQWTHWSRKEGLHKLAKALGKSIADESVQWQWELTELMANKKLWKTLTDDSKSVEECAKEVMLKYERPANQSTANQNKRANVAVDFYKAFYKEAPVSVEKIDVPHKVFIPRTHKPNKSDKWIKLFNTAINGGVSKCVLGSPTDPEANVLGNCVGYTNGYFNEIIAEQTGEIDSKYNAFTMDAERFLEKAKALKLKTGMTPMVGAIMCWQKGATLNHGDGAGHVSIVDRVDSPTKIWNSESGYQTKTNKSYVWRRISRSYYSGRWSSNVLYKFRGFIYNPALYDNPYEVPTSTVKRGVKGNDAGWVQWQLIKAGYVLTLDNSFGPKTEAAFKDWQKSAGLEVDGKCGKASRTKLINVI